MQTDSSSFVTQNLLFCGNNYHIPLYAHFTRYILAEILFCWWTVNWVSLKQRIVAQLLLYCFCRCWTMFCFVELLCCWIMTQWHP